jgi:hypothetical protein
VSITTKKSKGIDYLYFQAGVGKTLYLGPKEDLTKVKSDNVLKSLDYVKDKSTHYFEVEDKLISMLPEPERKEYLSKRSAELLARLRRLEEKLPIKVKPHRTPNIAQPVLNKINNFVIQHAGFNMKEKKEFEDFLSEIEKELKK